MSTIITGKSSPTSEDQGWRAQCTRSRRVIVQPSASAHLSRFMPHLLAPSARRLRRRGEVQEDLVERGPAQADVVDGDAGVVRARGPPSVSAAIGSATGALTPADRPRRPGPAPRRPAPEPPPRQAGRPASRTTTSMWSPPNRRLQLRRAAVGDDPAGVDDADLVGQLVGLIEVLGGQQHGGAAATRPRIAAHTSLRPRGSRPVVGSSRKRTGGRRMRLAARSSRRRMPPEYSLTGFGRCRPARTGPAAPRPRSRPGRAEVVEPAEHDQVLPPLSSSSTAVCCPTRPMRRRTSSGCSATSRRRRPRPAHRRAAAGSSARERPWSYRRRWARAARRPCRSAP